MLIGLIYDWQVQFLKALEWSEMDTSQNATAGTGGSGGNGIVVPQTNDTAGTTVVDDPKQNLNQVINSIQKTLGLIHQLYLTVSSFNAASQLPLLQRLLVSQSVLLKWCFKSFFLNILIVAWDFLTFGFSSQQFACDGARQHD